MFVDVATTASFVGALTVPGPFTDEPADLTAKLELRGLPAGRDVFYRVRFTAPDDQALSSEGVVGHLWTAPSSRRDVSLVWGGDTAGQGWGIDPARRGMRTYETMRQLDPDLFVHSGDTIYADGPLQAAVPLPDGTTWRNIVTPEKSKVAETLAEFRGNFRYNFLDDNLRRFNAQVPVLAQRDDHETTNNWYPGETSRTPATRSATSTCSPPERGGPSTSTSRRRRSPGRTVASTARSPTARCWRCSSSTCAPTRGPTPATTSPRPATSAHPRRSPRWPGCCASCAVRGRRGR